MHADSNTPQHRVPRVTLNCRKCGRPFEVLASQSLTTGRPYCGLDCAYEARQSPMEDRFWASVEKTASGCLLWKKAVSHGRPILCRPGHGAGYVRADFFAYELQFGSLPPDGKIHQTCGNYTCVNFEHLAPGPKPSKERRNKVSANPRPPKVECVCALPSCGKAFSVWPSRFAGGKEVKYCSPKCRTDASVRPLAERFWEKVDMNGPLPPERPELGPCHIWKGALTEGYGVLEGTRAARIALKLDGRPLKKGQWACHHCDVRPCVRFDHLFAGSPTDNNQDAVLKGHKGRRGPKGSGELNAVAVRVIRFLYATGRFSQTRLAEAHRVSQSTVGRAISRRIWSHVD
jgi:hypothetical protein